MLAKPAIAIFTYNVLAMSKLDGAELESFLALVREKVWEMCVPCYVIL